MGNEKYPHWLLNITIPGLLLIAGISVSMQISIQNAKIKREVKHQQHQLDNKQHTLEMLKNSTAIESEKCYMKSFLQVWSRSGCKEVKIPANFCYGMCYSVSVPNRRRLLLKVCRPTKWQYQNVTAACLKNGTQIIYITKQMIKIHECSCDLITLD